MRLLMLLGWAWACLGVVCSDTIIKAVGDEVVLTPSTVPQTITSIIWKYGPDFAVQWSGNGIEYFRHFKERGKLDVKSGTLTISSLTLTDTNSYTPEINNVLSSNIDLKVIAPVPKPVITVNDLTLTCDGDTKDAGTVAYFWSSDNGPLSYLRKDIQITKENCSQFFTCTMKNPVSEMKSDEFQPCPPQHSVGYIGVIVVVVLVIVLVVVVLFHKKKTGEWFYQKDALCWKADFWKDTTTQSAKDNSEGPGETAAMADH